MGDMREINDLINRMRDTDMSTRRHAIAHELRHAVAALAAEGHAVGVKSLVWDGWDNDDTVVGLYRVRSVVRVWAWTLDDDDVYLHGAVAANKADAQAAAQADYEARIMSAITITAPIDKIAEAEIAAAMWREEAVDSGTPDSVATGRTYGAFRDQSPELQARWLKFSRAALRALAGKGK